MYSNRRSGKLVRNYPETINRRPVNLLVLDQHPAVQRAGTRPLESTRKDTSMHLRSLNILTVLVVLIGLFAVVFAPAQITQAQDEASPPIIQPIDDGEVIESTPDVPMEQAPGGSLDLEYSDDLGDGGQPDDLPREITVGDERYLFDRSVPFGTDGLTLVAEDDTLTVYATGADGPFDSLYIASTSQADGELFRYLPERIGSPDVSCLAEVADIGQLTAGNAVYIFAGFETDLTPDTLQEIGASGENPLYTDLDAGEPFPELFIADPNGLLRFVIASGDGLPGSLAESLAFNGTRFEFVDDVTTEIDPSGLTKVGCAGPYPVFTPQDDSGIRYVRAGGSLFEFSGDPCLLYTSDAADDLLCVDL